MLKELSAWFVSFFSFALHNWTDRCVQGFDAMKEEIQLAACSLQNEINLRGSLVALVDNIMFGSQQHVLILGNDISADGKLNRKKKTGQSILSILLLYYCRYECVQVPCCRRC